LKMNSILNLTLFSVNCNSYVLMEYAGFLITVLYTLIGYTSSVHT